MSSIPTDRPVTGRDIANIQQAFGMLAGDACWIFGMSISRWTQVIRQNGDEELSDPSLALLVRLLDQHPELQLLPKYPEVEEMMALLESIQSIDSRRFSVMMGAEATAAYRWRRPGNRPAPNVSRLMYYLRMVLMAQPPERRAAVIDAWRTTVQLEGEARGVKDILNAGSWTPKKTSSEVVEAETASAPDSAADDDESQPKAKRAVKKKRTA